MSLKIDKVYLIKTKDGDLARIKQLCVDYGINDNGVFDNAASFHFAWGLGPEGLIYLSPTTFLSKKPDFETIEELEEFLEEISVNNNGA